MIRQTYLKQIAVMLTLTFFTGAKAWAGQLTYKGINLAVWGVAIAIGILIGTGLYHYFQKQLLANFTNAVKEQDKGPREAYKEHGVRYYRRQR